MHRIKFCLRFIAAKVHKDRKVQELASTNFILRPLCSVAADNQPFNAPTLIGIRLNWLFA